MTATTDALNALRQRRQQLEQELMAVIAPLLDRFERDTGVMPHRVDVRMQARYMMGMSEPVPDLAGVSVVVDLSAWGGL